jgi:hypothetical protein
VTHAQGTDRAHLIPGGSLINSSLGPVLDFTILRFGLGLVTDDAPALWASKVNRLLGYWLPTPSHTGAEQANAFADALVGYPVIGAALDYEPVGNTPPPSSAQVEDFRTTFKARRPDLPLGFYGTRLTVPLFPKFDWAWVAGDPKTVKWDMNQTVSGGVDNDEWNGDLASLEAFFGGGEMTQAEFEAMLANALGTANNEATFKEIANNALGLGDAVDNAKEASARRAAVFDYVTGLGGGAGAGGHTHDIVEVAGPAK